MTYRPGPGLTEREASGAYRTVPNKITTGAAAPDSTFNVLDYGAVGDGVTDDLAAFQAAGVAAMAVGGAVGVPWRIYGYAVSGPITAGSVAGGTYGNPVAFVGLGANGSRFSDPEQNIAPVTIRRTSPTATHYIFETCGYGFTLENIGLDGQYGAGALLRVHKGYEHRQTNTHFYRSGAQAMILGGLQNARLTDVHVDNCGSSSLAAVRFQIGDTPAPNQSPTTNTVFVDNMHIERCAGTDLDIGADTQSNAFAKWVIFNGLHIEATKDNSNLSSFKTNASVRVGNGIGIVIDDSFIYGGAGTLVEFDSEGTGGGTLDTASYPRSLTLANTYLFGHSDPTGTPARLVDLVKGDYFTMIGCTLVNATTAHVTIRDTFAGVVKIGSNNQYVTTYPSTTSTTVQDLRTVINGPPLDPYGFGLILGFAPGVSGQTAAWTGINQSRYARVIAGGTISKVGLHVGTASGNISVAVYRNTGTGKSALPLTRLATSGAVACPASGYAEVSLGATITVQAGDWLALSCDNTTATFVMSTDLASGLFDGLAKAGNSEHPLPSSPGSLTSSTARWPMLVGVP